jgi:2-amino-4-hydroxy-6-hydroxymethyldihydropteridine diphosphokinase
MDGEALIAVGSNIDPEKNIESALALLDRRCPIRGISTFYRTRPAARDNQPDFLNGACRCETMYGPRALKFEILREIERKLGRERTDDPHAPRPIDLDIALMGGLAVDEDGLQIPDPDIAERAFLAVPLYELAPEAIIPPTQQSLADIVRTFAQTPMPCETEFTQQLRKRFLV